MRHDVVGRRVEHGIGAQLRGQCEFDWQPIGDHDTLGPMRPNHRQQEQSDRACTEDHDRLVAHVAGDADRGYGRGHRFDGSRRPVIQFIGNHVKAVRRNGEVVSHPALVVATTEETQVLTEILHAAAALLAVPTRKIGLDGDPLTLPDTVYVRPECRDHADNLVTGVVRQVDERVSAMCGVSVGSAHARHNRVDEDLAGHRLGRGRFDDIDGAGRDHNAPHSFGYTHEHLLRMTVNLLAARWKDRAGVDAQMVSVEADAAQIHNGHGDMGSGGDGADADDVATPAARAAAIPAGSSSNSAQGWGDTCMRCEAST